MISFLLPLPLLFGLPWRKYIKCRRNSKGVEAWWCHSLFDETKITNLSVKISQIGRQPVSEAAEKGRRARLRPALWPTRRRALAQPTLISLPSRFDVLSSCLAWSREKELLSRNSPESSPTSCLSPSHSRPLSPRRCSWLCSGGSLALQRRQPARRLHDLARELAARVVQNDASLPHLASGTEILRIHI